MTWQEGRRVLEERLHLHRRRRSPEGEHTQPPFLLFNGLAGLIFRLLGLYGRGRRNAHDFHLRPVEIRSEALPTAFDGFTILFLSDLHAATLPDLMTAAARRADGSRFDLALLGGDYQCFGAPPARQTTQVMAELLRALTAKAPVLAVLGNHDRHDMAGELEARGVSVLVNRHVEIDRGGERMVVVGLDDIHAFHSEAAEAALRDLPQGFRIALIHSPEFASQARAAGIDLYLAGHTHGGQICLPGGKPVFTATAGHRAMASGPWRLGAMRGYTSTGLGTAGPPLRFHCRPEMALITLRRIP